MLAVGLLVLWAGSGVAEGTERPAHAITACLRDPACHEPMVVAHRALGVGAVENSVEAIQRALDQGIQIVKVDLRASRDGQWFLLHDPRLDRTTTGTGRLADHDATDLQRVRLQNGEPLPRFEAVYERFHERVVFILDAKVDGVESVATWIGSRGWLDGAVFLVGTTDGMQALARARARFPGLVVAARVSEWSDIARIERIFGRFPEIVHTDWKSRRALTELRRRTSGAKLFVKALGAERWIWPIGYVLVESMLSAAPELVLTNEPMRFLRRLRPAPGSPDS